MRDDGDYTRSIMGRLQGDLGSNDKAGEAEAPRGRGGASSGRGRANVGFSLLQRVRAAVEERAGECSNHNHAGREASEIRSSAGRDKSESERQKLSR